LKKSSKVILLLAAVAGAVIFAGLLAGVGPTSGESVARLALESASPWSTLLEPGPDASGALSYRPMPAFVTALLARLMPAGSHWIRIALLVLHLASILLAFRVLGRFLGESAAAAGALVFAVHPLHTASFASLSCGVQAMVPALLCLLCLDGLAAFREKGGAARAGLCLLYAALAGLSVDNIAVPLVIVLYDVMLPRAATWTRDRPLLSLHIVLWLLFGAGFAARCAVLGSAPSLPGDQFDAIVLLAAPSLPGSFPAAGPAMAASIVLLAGLAGLFALRSIIEGKRFPVLFLKALVLLAAAAAAQDFAPGPPPALASLNLPLIFFAGLCGVLLAGARSSDPAQPGPRRPSPAAVLITVLAAACFGLASVSACLAVRGADTRAAVAASNLLRELDRKDMDAVFVFNRPESVTLGDAAAAVFMEHDLLPRLRALGKGRLHTIFPIHDRDGLNDEGVRMFLYIRPQSACFTLGEDGAVSRIQASRIALHTAGEGVRPVGLSAPAEGGRTVLEANGFPVSFIPARETRRYRAVLLTPLGPRIAGRFETRARFPDGRETALFDDEWLHANVPLFNGERVLLWIEVFGGDGDITSRSPAVMFRLGAGD